MLISISDVDCQALSTAYIGQRWCNRKVHNFVNVWSLKMLSVTVIILFANYSTGICLILSHSIHCTVDGAVFSSWNLQHLYYRSLVCKEQFNNSATISRTSVYVQLLYHRIGLWCTVQYIVELARVGLCSFRMGWSVCAIVAGVASDFLPKIDNPFTPPPPKESQSTVL